MSSDATLPAASLAIESAPEADPHIHLRGGPLSSGEALAQSISTIAPSTTPAMTVPLVFALAGNGTWLAYLLTTAGILLIAACLSRFARYSASPGSLFQYASESLPPWASNIAAWALLFAYVGVGASVAGGFVNYANVLLHDLGAFTLTPLLLATIVVAAAAALACRNLHISARLMLAIEALSVTLVFAVLCLVVRQQGLRWDAAQLSLHGVSSGQVRMGIILALFSFVGFESATTLASEVRDPLRTIPRTLLQCAVMAGIFFIFAAYAETVGFHRAGANLGESHSPLRFLAVQTGVPIMGLLIDIGVFVSMFACTLSCIIAAARVMLLMGLRGLLPRPFGVSDARSGTPVAASLSAAAMIFLPVCALIFRGFSGDDIYGCMGAFAVYGFLTAYGLAVIALPLFLRRRGDLSWATLILCVCALCALLAAMAGNLYPVPPPPYSWLPSVYCVCMLCGLAWSAIGRSGRPPHSAAE